MSMTRLACVKTYGCQMNKHDSEIVCGLLADMGYAFTDNPEEADLILVNTCSIRARAEEKVMGTIGNFRRLKEARPDLILGVMGCMAQKEQERLFARAPHLDLVVGPQAITEIPALIAKAIEKKGLAPGKIRGSRLGGDFDDLGYVPEGTVIRRESGISAWVSIMKGCDNFCSYCIVPYVRGREKSRPVRQIVSEMDLLASEGFKEVVLLGQNVLAYGRGLETPADFADLVTATAGVEGIARIRYQTGHPRDYSDRVLKAFAGNPKVCRHFHLPLQAGSDRILTAMNRGHTAARFEELASGIRSMFPGCAITTDLIVGFPGETEEDFQKTLDLLGRVRFDAAHTYYFSPREGTKAATFPGMLPASERKARLIELNRIQDAVTFENNQALAGTTQEILVEGFDKRHGSLLTGRTGTNRIAVFPPGAAAPEKPVGALVEVVVDEATAWTLKCTLSRVISEGSGLPGGLEKPDCGGPEA